ncbi:uncharacterized protein LOC21404278 [Morus notabilis]|uniref:uncharacterized protein LOC21404278 n=1 Tax=Morus notabilis TaxID=981085 RepID=UPI000CED7AE0|nr:uncharacterized protein LOC21404278 [Morus notabilis]
MAEVMNMPVDSLDRRRGDRKEKSAEDPPQSSSPSRRREGTTGTRGTGETTGTPTALPAAAKIITIAATDLRLRRRSGRGRGTRITSGGAASARPRRRIGTAGTRRPAARLRHRISGRGGTMEGMMGGGVLEEGLDLAIEEWDSGRSAFGDCSGVGTNQREGLMSYKQFIQELEDDIPLSIRHQWFLTCAVYAENVTYSTFCRYSFLDKSVGISTLFEITNDSLVDPTSQIVQMRIPLSIPGLEGLMIPINSRGHILKLVGEKTALVRWEVLLHHQRNASQRSIVALLEEMTFLLEHFVKIDYLLNHFIWLDVLDTLISLAISLYSLLVFNVKVVEKWCDLCCKHLIANFVDTDNNYYIESFYVLI